MPFLFLRRIEKFEFSSAMGSMENWNCLSISLRTVIGLWFILMVILPVNGLRPLRQRRPWGEEVGSPPN